MRPSDEHLIRGFLLFRGVSDEIFRQVTADARIIEVPGGEVVLREGEQPDELFVLLHGLVESFARHAGKEAALSFIRPPAAFIVAAVWMDKPHLTSVRTVQASRLLAIPAPIVRAFIARDSAFANAVGTELAIRYRDLVKELKNQRMRSASERLANWLLQESAFARSAVFDLEIGKTQLASRLGMSVEHLSRAFAQLREHGVQVNGARIEIDSDQLAAFAIPHPLMDGSDL